MNKKINTRGLEPTRDRVTGSYRENWIKKGEGPNAPRAPKGNEGKETGRSISERGVEAKLVLEKNPIVVDFEALIGWVMKQGEELGKEGAALRESEPGQYIKEAFLEFVKERKNNLNKCITMVIANDIEDMNGANARLGLILLDLVRENGCEGLTGYIGEIEDNLKIEEGLRRL